MTTIFTVIATTAIIKATITSVVFHAVALVNNFVFNERET